LSEGRDLAAPSLAEDVLPVGVVDIERYGLALRAPELDRDSEIDQAELEAEPGPDERRRWFGTRRGAVEKDRAESEPESEPEGKRGFHLFRHAEEPEIESDGELESAIEIPALTEAPAEARMTEPETEPELSAGEMEARSSFWYHRHRERSEAPEEDTSSPADEPVDALEEDHGADRPVQRRLARLRGKVPVEAQPADTIEPGVAIEPGLDIETEQADTAAASAAEATAEIKLPQRIPIRKIKQTLDELEARRPPKRKRRWRFGAEAVKNVEEHSSAADAELEEALRLENEFRLNAEQERRRREREYQRSLRD